MKTFYSRRELYALGEPIGSSATRIEAGRRVYGGGGGIPIVSDVVDAVSDIGGGLVDTVGDVVGGAGDLVGSAVNTVTNIAGDALEPAVKVGEWSLEHPLEAAALAAGAYYGIPALMGEGAGAAGAAGAAEGVAGLGGWDAAMADLAGSAGMGDMAGGLSALDAGMGVYPTAGLSEAVGGLGGWDAAMADLAGSSPMTAASGTGLGGILGNLLGGSGSSGSGLTGMGALAGLGGLAGILSLLNADKGKYGVPGRQAYTGPMSQFKYSPSSFTPTRADPNMFRPRAGTVRTVADAAAQRMAEGGSTSKKPTLTPKAKLAAMGAWDRALAELGNNAYKAQMPVGPQAAPATNVRLGQLHMASGGLSDLGGYSDGGRMLKGPGDGMSDSIPATIGGKREARLADNEFVVPADVVSHLGNGSSDAGAKQLYKMMDRVRTARTGHKRQGKQIDPEKYLPA